MPMFSAADSLGSKPYAQIGAYLTEIGDLEAARPFTQATVAGQSSILLDKPYTQTGFVLGFIRPGEPGEKIHPIVGISEIAADKELIGTCIKITLDKFHVHSYPGFGTHNILCEFAGKNQVAGDSEELKFALRFNCADRASAAIVGAPIFLGLTVGADGIAFEGRTINVKSSSDDAILTTLDSVAFKSGLTLISTAQPALKPFASLATAAVAAVASRNRNAQVHSFNIGLDFGKAATSARLRCGSYVVIQTNKAAQWRWDLFQWNSDAMGIEPKAGTAPTEFNYMVFGVEKFAGTPAPAAPSLR